MTTFADPSVLEYRSAVRAWLRTALPAKWQEKRDALTEEENREVRRDWERIMWRDGYAGITWPREYGGRGLGIVEHAVFQEEAAEVHAPDPLDTVGKNLAGPAIIERGTVEQKAFHVPRILAAEAMWCEGFSEPGAGSDLAAVATTADRVGDEYRITGQKIWTTNAAYADYCYLLARTSKTAPRHHNLTVFLLNMRQPGVRVVPIREITGETTFFQVFFEDVRARPDEILGVEGQGWELSTLLGFRAQLQVVYGLRRYVEMKEWISQLLECTTETGGDSRTTASLEVRMHLLKWHVRRTIELMTTGRKWQPAASIVKLYWSELMQEITEAGWTTSCARHRAYWMNRYMWSRAATIYGGTAQIQRNVIADTVLALPR